MIAHYEKEYKIKRSEARKKATTHTPEYYESESRPPQTQFLSTGGLPRKEPGGSARKVGRDQTEAADELASGIRSVQVTGWESPLEQAQFLALRQSFID